jgi:hypothetical protein
MKAFFIDGLHIFIIVVIAAFVIFGTMALMGKFDHWDSRFIKKSQHIFRRVRRYLTRNRKREQLHQEDNYEGNRHEHQVRHETHTNDNENIR